VRFAEDRRARVPFALVGIVLLVGSAGLSATLAGGPAPRTDESVGVAVDRTTAATNTALREAIARAGRQAASAPVTAPSNTSAGGVLNDSTPYRDYFRLRIYLAASRALDSLSVRVGGGGRADGVRGSASLPATSNASALRRAKRRVEIEPAGNATSAGLRVRIENVSVTVTRDGQVVAREEVSPTLVVATPALALHRRVQRFESRLNRGPLDPGLGRRLTARLYALAWLRGYAQYGRAPISNVVANRHVELATNGAILREQRLAFGRSDPEGRKGLRWATARVGAMDLLSAADEQYGTSGTKALLEAAERYQRENPMPGGVTADVKTDDAEAGGGGPNHSATPPTTFRAGVNRTADRAFADLVTGENGTSLTGALRSAYAVDARVVAAVRQTESEPRPEPDPPGANWSLQGTEIRTTTRVESANSSRSESPPGTPSGWHLLGHETRRVVRTHELVANWTRADEKGEAGTGTNESAADGGNETRQTSQSWTEEFVVRVGVAGDHSQRVTPGGDGPRPVAGVHERAGALDGPNFRDVAARTENQLVADRGGFDALARRAVEGTLDTRPQTVTGRRPDDLREWVYRDLATLRERVRNVSVVVAARSTLGRESAAAKLAQTLRERRASLIDAPERYDGVADRARVAARAAYLHRVVARLDARAARADATRTGIDRALADAGTSLDRVRRVLRARGTPDTPPPRAMVAEGPGRSTNLSVVGAPPYLTLAELDHDEVAAIPNDETVYPLAARNVNVFAVPYGDAAGKVASTIAGTSKSGRTDLRTAAVVLRAANRTLAEADNQTPAEADNQTPAKVDNPMLAEENNQTPADENSPTLARRREKLQQSLAGSMQEVRRSLVAELGAERFDLTRRERRAAVKAGLARWNTTHGRALAVANGSAAQAIVAAAVARQPSLRRADRRDWLRLRTELALESASREVGGAPRSVVNRTTSATRSVAEAALKQALSNGLQRGTEEVSERWFGEVLGSTPTGLPVAPVPGYWYATVNVWTVSVEGQYARFAVSAPQGLPGESVTYVREETAVRVDWDDDGERELVGHNAPVSFETETVVAVVVPPGPPGVGDRDGQSNETSPGRSPD
jgi:hypothetical protein